MNICFIYIYIQIYLCIHKDHPRDEARFTCFGADFIKVVEPIKQGIQSLLFVGCLVIVVRKSYWILVQATDNIF